MTTCFFNPSLRNSTNPEWWMISFVAFSHIKKEKSSNEWIYNWTLWFDEKNRKYYLRVPEFDLFTIFLVKSQSAMIQRIKNPEIASELRQIQIQIQIQIQTLLLYYYIFYSISGQWVEIDRHVFQSWETPRTRNDWWSYSGHVHHIYGDSGSIHHWWGRKCWKTPQKSIFKAKFSVETNYWKGNSC